MNRFLLVAILLALPHAGLRAGDVESLHAFDFNFEIKPRWTVRLHTRARTFENIGAFNQFRVGPVVEWEAAPRLTALAGYYFIEQNTRVVHEPYEAHRMWSGAVFHLLKTMRWTLDARTVIERAASGRFEDYTRFRSGAKFARATAFGEAYASGEAQLQQGIWYGRYTGGLEWRLGGPASLGVGYEYRDAARGPGSHVVGTYFEWDAYRQPR
jgi:hypothetical protein